MHLRSDFYPGDPYNAWNAGLSAWFGDYLTASQYLEGLGSCDPDLGILGYNLSGYCATGIDAQITAAYEDQVIHPAAAMRAWAAIDRRLVDAAATIPYGNGVHHYFVGPRVGNIPIHPITGPLLAQMPLQ